MVTEPVMYDTLEVTAVGDENSPNGAAFQPSEVLTYKLSVSYDISDALPVVEDVDGMV